MLVYIFGLKPCLILILLFHSLNYYYIQVGNHTALSLARHGKSLHTLDLSWCRNLTDNAVGLIVDNCLSLRLLKLFGCSQVYISIAAPCLLIQTSLMIKSVNLLEKFSNIESCNFADNRCFSRWTLKSRDPGYWFEDVSSIQTCQSA